MLSFFFWWFAVCQMVAAQQNITVSYALTAYGPVNVAFNSKGELFVVNSNSNTIGKQTSVGVFNNSFIVLLGNPRPFNMAFNLADELFVSMQAVKAIYKFYANGTVLNSTFGGQLDFVPYGISFDRSGTLFVYDSTFGRIHRITGSGVMDPTPFIEAGIPKGNIGGISFDRVRDDLYLTSSEANQILRVNVTTNDVMVFAKTGLSRPLDVVVDCVGNLYVSNFNGNSISKLTPNGSVSTYVPGDAGLIFPWGVTLDKQGNLYVTNSVPSPMGYVSKI